MMSSTSSCTARPVTPGLLRRTLRCLDRLDLIGPLDPAALAKVIRDHELDPGLPEQVGLSHWKVGRDRHAAKAAIVEEAVDDRREEFRATQAFRGEVLRAEVVHVHDLCRAGFLADAPLLERA